jgi:CSLREA domain-containing protein
MPGGGRAAGKAGWVTGAALFAALLVPASTPAATINVKSNADEFDVAGNCTLREAIQTANSDADRGGCHRRHIGAGAADTVVLEGKTEYPITIPGGNEDGNATGDFDIASRITIEVDGKGRASIDANEMDRAVDVLDGGNLHASRLQIANGNPPSNGFSNGGAGILNRGSLTLTRSELTLNDAVDGQAINGGAVHAVGQRTILKRVDMNHNHADQVGGAIAHSQGLLRVVDSVIDQNTSDGGGGGIIVSGSQDSVRVLLKASTISGNTSFQDGVNAGGGGLMVSYFGEGTLRASSITVSGNTSWASGAGIYSYNGTIAVNGATVTRNTANFDGDGDGKGGGITGVGVQARNSIIDGNEDASATDPKQDCFLTGGSPAHNLVSPGGGCAEAGSNEVAFDSLLAELGDYGGRTPTHKVLKGSLAIGNAGKDAPKHDQRGVKRDRHPDIGAYER